MTISQILAIAGFAFCCLSALFWAVRLVFLYEDVRKCVDHYIRENGLDKEAGK